MLEPGYGVAGDVVYVLLHLRHLPLDLEDLLVIGLGVELGNLANRFFDQLEDVVHHYFLAEKVLVELHLVEDVLELLLPGLLVLFQYLVDTVLEEDLLE